MNDKQRKKKPRTAPREMSVKYEGMGTFLEATVCFDGVPAIFFRSESPDMNDSTYAAIKILQASFELALRALPMESP